MPKVSTDNLFQLIKSLEKSEKRYFKLYTSLHTIGSKNKYVKLFDLIEGMDEYDEASILMDDEFNRNSFFELKKYLYDLIIKSLLSYHSSVKSQIADYIHQVEILAAKRLYNLCVKPIKKAKKIAYQHEYYTSLFDLIAWELKITGAQNFQGKNQKWIDAIYQEWATLLNDYTKFQQSSYFVHSIYFMGRDEIYSRQKSKVKRSQALLKEFLKIPLSNKSVLAEKNVNSMYGAYYLYRNDFSRSLHYMQKGITLIESNPHLIKEDPARYAGSLRNLIAMKVMSKQYNGVDKLFDKLKKVNFDFFQKYGDFYASIVSEELNFIIVTGNFKKGIELINDLESKVLKMDDKRFSVHYKTHFKYNAAIINIGVNNFKKAKYYLVRILGDPKAQYLGDVQSFTRIVSLIVYYELGEFDLLESAIKSTYRYLKKRKKLYALEAIVLNYISKKLLNVRSARDIMNLFVNLRTEMAKLQKDPYESNAFHYFDFISWLDSKIHRKSFEQIVKQKK